jgi:hypothetical protein
MSEIEFNHQLVVNPIVEGELRIDDRLNDNNVPSIVDTVLLQPNVITNQSSKIQSTTKFLEKWRNKAFYFTRKANEHQRLEVKAKQQIVKELKTIVSERVKIDAAEKTKDYAAKIEQSNNLFDILPDLLRDGMDGEVTDVFIKPNDSSKVNEVRVRPKPHGAKTIIDVVDHIHNDMQTDAIDSGIQTEEDPNLIRLSKQVNRRKINKIVKTKRFISAHNSLLNYLRIKYFMRRRDALTLNNMSTDARTWLTRNDHSCETDGDYLILSSSVSAAFMVSPEEMELRQMMKDRQNYENMIHLNNTLDGRLGKVNPTINYSGESSFAKIFKTELMIPKARPVV